MPDKIKCRLYKQNVNGSLQVWELWYNNDSYWTATKVGDKQYKYSKPIKVNLRKGRNLEEQMTSTLASRERHRRENNFVDDYSKIQITPKKSGFDLIIPVEFEKNRSVIEYPCAAQPVYDGCVCSAFNGEIYDVSGKRLDKLKHLKLQLSPLFKRCKKVQLHGMLYRRGMKHDIEEIMEAVYSKDVSKLHTGMISELNFLIYDARTSKRYSPTDGFLDRWVDINDTFDKIQEKFAMPNVEFVDFMVVPNENEVINQKILNISMGINSLWVRNLHSRYEQGNLLMI